jgi:hypothetical protein
MIIRPTIMRYNEITVGHVLGFIKKPLSLKVFAFENDSRN